MPIERDAGWSTQSGATVNIGPSANLVAAIKNLQTGVTANNPDVPLDDVRLSIEALGEVIAAAKPTPELSAIREGLADVNTTLAQNNLTEPLQSVARELAETRAMLAEMFKHLIKVLEHKHGPNDKDPEPPASKRR